MKDILNDLYQHKKLSESQAKEILINIASRKIQRSTFSIVYDGFYDATNYG